jgi:cobalt-zinc-cadmium resistance protein CzcA
MLNRIILYSVKNKLIIGILTIALVFWGGWSAMKLPIDAVPDITNNQVQVITYSPSLSPQEVERLITAPLELGLSNIPDLVEIRSISRFGLSVITAVFTDETDVYRARQLVSERLVSATELIPPGIGRPELGPVSTGLGEIYQYVLEPEKGYENRFDLSQLRTIQDWTVRRAILGTKGVADVSSFGGNLKQYEVSIDPERLRSFGLSLSQVFDALEHNNANSGGAYIAKGPQAWFIRSEGLVTNLDEIGEIIIRRNESGLPLLIRDVATMRFGHSVRFGALTVDSKGEGVGGIVLMLKGENSGEVSRAVRARMEEVKKMLPKGLKVTVYLDRSDLVKRAVSTVENNLMEGALIVVFVLVLILGNFRAGLIVASVIPLAMLFALGMMNLFGVSGNLMSLGAIDFGLIVDGAVIIVEATLHHLLDGRRTGSLTQKQMDEEVHHSASRIMNSAVFGEIIILIVYLPILALVGIEGKMFRPMAQTVAFAIAGASILSLTYVPMASALFLSKKINLKITFSDRLMAWIYKGYAPLLSSFISLSKWVVVTAVILFCASIALFLTLGGEFIPSLDEGDLAVETRLIPGTSMDKTINVTLKAAEILQKQFPEVRQVVGKIGTSEIPTDPMPFEACDLMILLKDKSEWPDGSSKEELVSRMKASLEAIPGVSFGFQQPIQMRFNELMTGAKQDVAIKIYGDDLDLLAKSADQLGKLIDHIDGVQDLYIEQVAGLPEMVARIQREKLSRYGLSVEDVNQTIQTAFAGSVAGKVYEGEKRFDLVIRLDSTHRERLEDLQSLYVQTPDGTQIPLSEVAEVKFQLGPNQFQRDNTHRRIMVAFNVRDRDVESLVAEIQSVIDRKLKLPEGYSISIGGQFKNLQEAKARLQVAVPAALALIFVLLFFTFGSIKQSILIFSAIPLSAIGGIVALWIRDMPFSISAGVGFIALFGVAVLNGIVLMSEFNRMRKDGEEDLRTVVFESTRVRLRPVLMTALVASLGFLPMALSHGAGAEVQKPLATVVIGGLVSATLLTLLVLPVLYFMFENSSGKKGLQTLALLVLVGCLGSPAYAQTKTTMTYQEAEEQAIRLHPSVRFADLQFQSKQELKKSAIDPGKFQIGLQYGQYNSYYQDQNFTIGQSLPMPIVFSRIREQYEAQAKEAGTQAEMSRQNIRFEMRVAFENLHFIRNKIRYLKTLDSLFQVSEKASGQRFRQGETNQLEFAMAQSQSHEIKAMLKLEEGEEAIVTSRIRSLTQTDSRTDFEDRPLEWQPADTALHTFKADSNLHVQFSKRELETALSNWKLEKTRLLPDISLGYFNQSLRGIPLQNGSVAGYGNRFQGFSMGLQIPVWQKPARARIKAADLLARSKSEQSNAVLLEVESEISQVRARIRMHGDMIRYLEEQALPTARLIRSSAFRNYQTGNSGILELGVAIRRSLQTEEQLTTERHQFALSVLQLKFLTHSRF